MQQPLEPRQVTLRDALGWFKEAAMLILRRPHYYLLPILPIAVLRGDAIDYLLIFPTYFLLLFTLSLGMSECVDHSRPLAAKHLWQQLLSTLGFNGGLLLGMIVIRLLVVLLLATGYTPPMINQTTINVGPSWAENIHELSSSAMILLIFFQYIHGWFRHALRQLQGIPASVAKQLSRKASIINFFVIWQVSMGMLLSQLVSFYLPLWIEFTIKAALLIILPPYCYVAYRHIFLGKKANAPVRVPEVEGIAAMKHS